MSSIEWTRSTQIKLGFLPFNCYVGFFSQYLHLQQLLYHPPFSRRKKSKMFTALRKIQKDKGTEPSEFDESVAQAFFDLENTNSEMKSDLKNLYINSAVQIDVSGSKKAVVIHVPYRLRKAFKKIHVRLTRELEKKFSGKAAAEAEAATMSMVRIAISNASSLDEANEIVCGNWLRAIEQHHQEYSGNSTVGDILDVGCSVGACTRFLAHKFASAQVTHCFFSIKIGVLRN